MLGFLARFLETTRSWMRNPWLRQSLLVKSPKTLKRMWRYCSEVGENWRMKRKNSLQKMKAAVVPFAIPIHGWTLIYPSGHFACHHRSQR